MSNLLSSFLRDYRRNIATSTITTNSNPLRINCQRGFTGEHAIDYRQTIIQRSWERMLRRTTVIDTNANHFRCRRDISDCRNCNVAITEHPTSTGEVNKGQLVLCRFLGSFWDE